MRSKEFAAQERGSIMKGTELAASLAAFMAEFLRKKGISVRQADEVSLEVMCELRRHYGGQSVYFARDVLQKAAERAEEMHDIWVRNELSVVELSQKYGFSVQWVYHCIRSVREKRRLEREAILAEKRALEAARHKRENG